MVSATLGSFSTSESIRIIHLWAGLNAELLQIIFETVSGLYKLKSTVVEEMTDNLRSCSGMMQSLGLTKPQFLHYTLGLKLMSRPL